MYSKGIVILFHICTSPTHAFRTATSQLSEVDMCTYDVIGGQYEVVKKQKQIADKSIQSPPTNTGGESKEKFNLNQCPAYGPVTQQNVGGADETGEYAVVASTSQM